MRLKTESCPTVSAEVGEKMPVTILFRQVYLFTGVAVFHGSALSIVESYGGVHESGIPCNEKWQKKWKARRTAKKPPKGNQQRRQGNRRVLNWYLQMATGDGSSL